MTSSDEMRRRIYAALKEHYSGEDLIGGMRLWKQKFAQRNRFSQHQFAMALSRQFKIDSSYKQILSSIAAAMQTDLNSLPQAPSDARLDLHRKDLAPARCFVMLLSKIGGNTEDLMDTDTKERIIESLRDKEFKPEIASAVIHNLTASNHLTLIRMRDAERYRLVLNAIYVVICEKLGPVLGDQILSDSVKETDKTVFGKLHSARNFL
jgi:hypothetical protein